MKRALILPLAAILFASGQHLLLLVAIVAALRCVAGWPSMLCAIVLATT